MNRQLLEQPFPQDIIKNRQGLSGKTFNYVEGAEYIKRLNDAFEGSWSFEVVEHQIQADEVIVLEDSYNGVLAARRAGMFVVAVPNQVTGQADLSQANLILASLEEMPLKDLLAHLENHK